MVIISTQAQIALNSLLSSDRDYVQRLLTKLEYFPKDSSLVQQAVRLNNGGLSNLYIIRATRDLRIIFRYFPDMNKVEVVDIVTHQRLESMYGVRA